MTNRKLGEGNSLKNLRKCSTKFIAVLKIITLFTLASCTPQGGDGGGRRNSEEGSSVVPTPTVPITTVADDLFWFADATNVGESLQVNVSRQSVFYLRGESINLFLSRDDNNEETYCLVGNYSINNATAKEQIRLRAVPIAVTNFSTGEIERFLRIDFGDTVSGALFCPGLASRTIGGAAPVDVDDTTIPSPVAFTPEDLCTGCTQVETSLDVNLYKSTANSITGGLVTVADVNLSGLTMRLDFQNDSTSPGGSCTNSGCQAQGFDCCLDSQCVNDGQVRNGVDQTSAAFLQAQADVAINPANFKKYLQFYYVCGQGPDATPTPTATPDAIGTANTRLKARIFDFYCLEKYAESGDVDETHCINFDGCGQDSLSVTDISQENFNIAIFAACTSTQAAVLSRVRGYCGCAADAADPPPNDPTTVCPGTQLRVTRNSSNIITDIQCDVETPPSLPTPVQNLSLGINGRRAPRRFFDINNNSVDDLEDIFGTPDTPSSPQAEGEFFSYLDEVGKTSPVNGSFNMNAITGQMVIDLSRALPAKMLPVEFDQVYVISALAGNYTPCPTCAADSWFGAFFTQPPSKDGIGLQAIGHTTFRDNFSTNTTNGNYEDNIFGRACWVPPTMIPFTHMPAATTAIQRRDRLEAQAALYANGYQRDWYGFNKGALIGSFDGVTWFAIGKNRRVRASSNKLFLAINAAFADLADPTDTFVSVIQDFGSTATDFDYDFNRTLTDPRQNLGASCQFYHSCDTDSECVAKLGWEYMCADVSNVQTLWPRFDINADEQANDFQELTYIQMLQSGVSSGSTRRCVYRGAGAPCKQNFSNLPDTIRKNYTCAPNFTCEGLDSGNFNDTVVREPNNLSNFLLGQDAEVLGRPSNYLTGNSALTASTVNALNANAGNQNAQFTADDDVGVCRPGKFLDTISANPNWVLQHSDRDATGKTDYVSQVGSCESTYSDGIFFSTLLKRTQTCPAFDDDGNYLHVDATGGEISTFADQARYWSQNSCGGEALDVAQTNAFASIELDPIGSLASFVTPGLARHACYRRAGSVCHTNLDCAPNTLHENIVDFFDNDFFGGTLAEKEYWRESLICGQSEAIPFLNSSNFDTFDITQNRCCREVGKDFTMYQANDANFLVDNPNLDPSLFTSGDPDGVGRYSRYTVVGNFSPDSGLPEALEANEYFTVPDATQGVTPERYQWRTFHETGKKTCCGGGWIRKFADGTTDWSVVNRLQISATDFSCVNYANTITETRPNDVPQTDYDIDFGKLCSHPRRDGCAQIDYLFASDFPWFPVDDFGFGGLVSDRTTGTNNTFHNGGVHGANTLVATINTAPFTDTTNNNENFQLKTKFAPFQPTGIETNPALTTANNFFQPGTVVVAMKLPSYINGEKNINNVYFANRTNPTTTSGAAIAHCRDGGTCAADGDLGGEACDFRTVLGAGAAAALVDNSEWWCVNDASNELVVKRDFTVCPGDPDECTTEGLIIEFMPVNTPDHVEPAGNIINVEDVAFHNAGSNLYYLTKASRFELLGIPQIFYEPIYCSSDGSNLVPNLFQTSTGVAVDNRTDYNNSASFIYTPQVAGQTLGQIYNSQNTGNDPANARDIGGGVFVQNISSQENVQLNQVFSAHEFKCCRRLGDVTSSSDACCSSFSGQNAAGETVCQLPPLTDLNVYFNRFVSGEGEGEDLPSGGLVDDDFIPETGEPKVRQETTNKLIALGTEFCSSGAIRTGVFFGSYVGEPADFLIGTPDDATDQVRGIVDSFNDFEQTNDGLTKDLNFFNIGLRWNHHIYCDLPQ